MSDDLPGLLRAAPSPADAIQLLRAHFPGTQIWYGAHSKQYMAIHNGHGLHTATAIDLYNKLRKGTAQ